MNSDTTLPTVNFRRIVQKVNILSAVLASGLLGSNVATLALLGKPSSAMAYVQYVLFAWRMIARQGLTQRQFHDLFPAKDCVSVNLLPTISYFTQWDANYAKDALYLALLAQTLSPQVIFEIGTLRGDSALLFALNTPAESRIYTLDLPPDGSSGPTLATTLVDDKIVLLAHARTTQYLYQSNPLGSKVTQLYGDSASFNFDAYKGQVDLFFIDGAHSYEYVRSDTLKALACVKPGGVIAWHDYGRWGVNGVTRWLHEFTNEGRSVYRLPGSSLAVLKV